MQYAKDKLEIQDLEADTGKVVICAHAILVLDIGAGTTDAAIVKENTLMTSSNPYPYLHVDSSGVAVAGDMFDEKIADYLAEQFIQNVDGMGSRQLRNRQSVAYRRLKVSAKRAKGGRIRLTRQEMNEAIDPVVNQIISCAKGLLDRNKQILQGNLDIIMTGGSSYIPYIRKRLAQVCRQISQDRIYVKSPEKAIGFGAAIFAADMGKIRPNVDFSYGVNTYINDVEMIQTLIPAGVELPYTVEHDYCTRHEDQTKVSFRMYEYRLRKKIIPIDEQKQMKVAAAVHEFRKAVPKGTKCTAVVIIISKDKLKMMIFEGALAVMYLIMQRPI